MAFIRYCQVISSHDNVTMTWAFAKASKLFAIAYTLRSTLKLLKRYSNDEKIDTKYGVLMFWTIFGVFVVWEEHMEYFFRWIPFYYYLKAFFILFMTFHQLGFTKYVFTKFYIPFMGHVHHSVDYSLLLVAEYKNTFTLLNTMALIVVIIFPEIIQVSNLQVQPIIEMTDAKNDYIVTTVDGDISSNDIITPSSPDVTECVYDQQDHPPILPSSPHCSSPTDPLPVLTSSTKSKRKTLLRGVRQVKMRYGDYILSE